MPESTTPQLTESEVREERLKQIRERRNALQLRHGDWPCQTVHNSKERAFQQYVLADIDFLLSLLDSQAAELTEEKRLRAELKQFSAQDAASIWNSRASVAAPQAVTDGISWTALLACLERLRSKTRNPDAEWYHGWNAAIQCLINDVNARSLSPVSPFPTPEQETDGALGLTVEEWTQLDRGLSALSALERVGWHLGVVGNHESEIRTCLLSVPELHLEDYPGGVAELGPLDIQEDCLRAIDYLKTLIVLLNRLALGDLDPPESRRVVAESAEYLKRMRNFPIRSQNERAKSDRD